MEHTVINEISYENRVKISGILQDEFAYSHTTEETSFYCNQIAVMRRSGVKDILPIMIKKNLLPLGEIKEKYVEIMGEIRSCMVDGHLKVFIFPKQMHICDSISELEMGEDRNELLLKGNIRSMALRETPFGRIIVDFILSIKREIHHQKYDYLPCIAWGDDALRISHLDRESTIQFIGRFQSRQYNKMVEGVLESKITYEISVMRILSSHSSSE